MSKTYDVAVVGATGAVGESMLDMLARQTFPVGKVHALAGDRSVGQRVRFDNRQLPVRELESFDFQQVRLALFAATADAAERYAPKAMEAGCLVIDASARFRHDDAIPLVVAHVNPAALAGHARSGIVASPDAMTIQLALVLKPILDAVGLERVDVTALMAVSGGGRGGVEELAGQSARLLNGQPIDCQVFPRRIAFNLLPQIDVFQGNGYTRGEMQIVRDLGRLLGDERLQVNPTAVWAPVFHGHCAVLHLQTRDKLTEVAARDLLAGSPGLTVLDEHRPGGYPTPEEASGQDSVQVGRIRESLAHPLGLDLWVVADNPRNAALNCLQIAEILIKERL